MISNALKFTNRGGKVSINIELLPQKSRSEYDLLKFSVSDTGIGIKKKNHKKLFKMFVSIKNIRKKINTKGIGLGLCISKLIVNKFNGEISFTSKYKKGSTFWFTFESHIFDVALF